MLGPVGGWHAGADGRSQVPKTPGGLGGALKTFNQITRPVCWEVAFRRGLEGLDEAGMEEMGQEQLCQKTWHWRKARVRQLD